MSDYEKSLEVLKELYGRDYTFVLATAKDNVPSTRVVDTYFEDGVFWVVTYAKSRKVQEIMGNPNVSLCHDFQKFQAKAYNVGHPLAPENQKIREQLIQVFAPWYFAHNNENDEHMCYVKVVPETGFFNKGGTGYDVNFIEKTAREVPFAPGIESIE